MAKATRRPKPLEDQSRKQMADADRTIHDAQYLTAYMAPIAHDRKGQHAAKHQIFTRASKQKGACSQMERVLRRPGADLAPAFAAARASCNRAIRDIGQRPDNERSGERFLALGGLQDHSSNRIKTHTPGRLTPIICIQLMQSARQMPGLNNQLPPKHVCSQLRQHKTHCADGDFHPVNTMGA